MERQHRLIRLLRTRREVDVHDAARELEASPRTLYRDLDVLQRVGVPLYQERIGERVRWRVVDGYRHDLHVTLSWAEMLALSAGKSLLAGLQGTFFHEAASTAMEKVRDALPPPLAARSAALLRHVTAAQGEQHDYEGTNGGDDLVLAIERCLTVTFDYRKPSQRVFESRRVDPYHLHLQGAALYLVGQCHERSAVRIFALTRMRKLALTNNPFVRPDVFEPTAYFHGRFGAWSGRPQRIRLRFAPEASRVLAERRFHPSQTSQWRADGRLDVTFKVPLSPALVAFAVSFGPRVEVVGPRSLQDAVRGEHEEAIAGQKKSGRV